MEEIAFIFQLINTGLLIALTYNSFRSKKT
jgi:hypothetical protein